MLCCSCFENKEYIFCKTTCNHYIDKLVVGVFRHSNSAPVKGGAIYIARFFPLINLYSRCMKLDSLIKMIDLMLRIFSLLL